MSVEKKLFHKKVKVIEKYLNKYFFYTFANYVGEDSNAIRTWKFLLFNYIYNYG